MIKKNKYTFGPVLSRRLGLSLGIDLVPRKKCNLDCLYCEVCPTDMHDEERINYVDFQDLVSEIKKIKSKIDYLTITGSGEPTLHKDLDKIISVLKREFSYPVVMLTNSLLIRKESVRKELTELDLIIPSLDAASQSVFEKINRPVPGVMIKDVINGLIELRQVFSGKIWLEVLFVKGINDSDSEIQLLSEAIRRINPDRVQLNTVIRPPAYNNISPLSDAELQKIADVLGFDNVDIIGSSQKITKANNVNKEEVLNYLKRRPAKFEELLNVFGIKANELRGLLEVLENNSLVKKEVHNGMVFFKKF